ncbi:MAG: hypothetical protein ACYCW6_29060 [Candidatus Xenobia bacterium]
MLRVLLATLLTWVFWTLLLFVPTAVLDWPLPIAPVVGAALTLLQWLLAPWLLQSLYKVAPWTRSGVLVLETAEPWLLTYGRRRTIVTRGLLDLFADRPDLLETLLSRERYLADRPDLGVATMLAAPLLWAGVTAEFFVGSGREAAVRRGFSAGIFLGMLAHVVAGGLTRVAALCLQGRQGDADAAVAAEPLREVLLRLCEAHREAPADAEAALRRGYALQTRVLGPLDPLEAARLGVIGGDITAAACRDTQRPAFHPPLRERLNLGAGPTAPRTFWPWLPWTLSGAGFGVFAVTHRALALPFIGFAVGWIVVLMVRYPWRHRTDAWYEGTAELHGTASHDPSRPWFPCPLLKIGDRWWPLVWRPLVPGLGLLLPLPLYRASGDVRVTGWRRGEPFPYLEATRIQTSRHVIVNRTVAAHLTLAFLLLVMGLVMLLQP